MTRALHAALFALCIPALASAQSVSQPGRVQIGIGAGVIGGAGLGGQDASLRARDGSDFRLFRTESDVGRARTLEARAGFALTRRYAVEVRFGLSHPDLSTVVSADVEGAPDATLAERIDQYIVDAAFIVSLDRFRFGPLVPFGSVGAGYLRQLHEGLMLIEEGTAYHVGGGVIHRFVSRDRGVLKGAGLRGDVRLYLLSGGIAVQDRTRPRVAASGGFFVVF